MIQKQSSDLDTNNKPSGSRNIYITITTKISDTFMLFYDNELNFPDSIVCLIFIGTQHVM